MRVLPALVAGLVLCACASSTTARRGLPPLQTVPRVDLARYLGTWYEIAAFPQRFQKGCTATTAHYALRKDGRIAVTNRCRLRTVDGREKVARGIARVKDRATNARLEVTFFRPFWGAYWVIYLDPDYRFAVVGHPGRDYLWILARTPRLDDATYQGILGRLVAQGYDVSRLVRTAHRP